MAIDPVIADEGLTAPADHVEALTSLLQGGGCGAWGFTPLPRRAREVRSKVAK